MDRQEPQMSNKEQKWNELAGERPNLIIEVGAAGGVEAQMLDREFKSGRFNAARYLAIDPNVAIIDAPYKLALRGRVGELNLDRFTGSANEVWIKNLSAALSTNEAMINQVKDLLTEDGTVYVLETYASGKKKSDVIAFLGQYFDVEDLTNQYLNRSNIPEDAHPFIKVAVQMPTSKTPEYVLILRKKEFSSRSERESF